MSIEHTENGNAAQTSSERAPGGRFGPGNPGGPGNPFGRRLAANRAAILNTIGEEQIKQLMLALFDQAMAGDKGAAKLILEYAVGKPQAAREPDRVEFEEWQIAKEKRVPHAEAMIALLDMPVEKATDMAGQKPLFGSELFEPEPEPEPEVEPVAVPQPGTPEHTAMMNDVYQTLADVFRRGSFEPADGEKPFVPFGDGGRPQATGPIPPIRNGGRQAVHR